MNIIACSTCPEPQEIDISCFDSFASTLKNDSVKSIDFSKEIRCFSWDSLEIGGRGSYEKYPCMNFTFVDKGKYAKKGTIKGTELESNLDWLDRDRHWQMIYFYHNGQILNKVLVISQPVVSFFEMTLNQGDIFLRNSDSKFIITDRVLGGISEKELVKHRQMMKE